MALGYSAEVKEPTTRREGLSNAIQIAINLLEKGDINEAIYRLVDLKDDVNSKANPYEIGGKPRRSRKQSNYMGDVNVD